MVDDFLRKAKDILLGRTAIKLIKMLNIAIAMYVQPAKTPTVTRQTKSSVMFAQPAKTPTETQQTRELTATSHQLAKTLTVTRQTKSSVMFAQLAKTPMVTRQIRITAVNLELISF